jgi:hypothetical protein
MGIKVFYVEPTGKLVYGQSFECKACDHITRVDIGEIDGPGLPRANFGSTFYPCEKCGASLLLWSASGRTIYRRPDTGEVFNKEKLPPGACYDANWLRRHSAWCGEDGRSLHVVLPDGHHWNIDGQATNCTKPDDDVHKCWVRHGKPEDGTLHVDKNGKTCSAGAGSIATSKWHGFLHNGELTVC